MKKNIIVRQAVFADIESLALLFDRYRQFYEYPGDLHGARDFLTARFNHGESILFIAEQHAESVGFAQMYPSFSSVALARSFLLNDLFVRDDCRREGVGSRLLTACVDYAGSLGAVRLTLATALGNKPAQALYAAAGWKRDEQFSVYHYIIGA